MPPSAGLLLRDHLGTELSLEEFGEAAALPRRALRVLERRVDVLEALAEVRGQLIFGPTKTGSARSVQIPGFLAEELAAHMATYLRPPADDREERT